MPSRDDSTTETPAVGSSESALVMLMQELRRGIRDLNEKFDSLRESLGAHDRELQKIGDLDKKADDHEQRIRKIEEARATDAVERSSLSTKVAIYGAIGAAIATAVMGSVVAAVAYAITHIPR